MRGSPEPAAPVTPAYAGVLNTHAAPGVKTPTVYIPASAPASMGENPEKDGDAKKPKPDRLFTGSRSWITSSGNIEVPAKSWPDEE